MDETRGRWTKLCCIQGRLDGKIAIVTGSDRGLGFQTTAELARRGAIVIMACLDLEDGQKACQHLLETYGPRNPDSVNQNIACQEIKACLSPIQINQLIVEQIDLASLDSVRQFVQRIRGRCSSLHYLINNAGLIRPTYTLTKDNFEMMMGVNFLGPFLLTELLIPLLIGSAPSRIIFLSSVGHRWVKFDRPNLMLDQDKFDTTKIYCQSKLALTVYARELGLRLKNFNVLTASVDPGFVRTDIRNQLKNKSSKLLSILGKFIAKDPWTGVQTTLYAILKPDLQTAEHYRNCQLKQPAETVLSQEEQQWLKEHAEQLVGLTNYVIVS